LTKGPASSTLAGPFSLYLWTALGMIVSRWGHRKGDNAVIIREWKVEEFDPAVKLRRGKAGAVYIFDGLREVAACRFNERGGVPLEDALLTARQIVADHNAALAKARR